MSTLDKERAVRLVESTWEESIVPQLIEYIRIPNKSPAFDLEWARHGYMDQALDLIVRWCETRGIEGLALEVVRLPGRTPLIFMEIPAVGATQSGPDLRGPNPNSDDCVLLYGHLDKQPEMEGWRENLGPWVPVREGDRLYGRGAADDGYAAFASLTALEVLADQNIIHTRCVVIIEACEESGSFDLPHYIDALSERIGQPSLVICLDSGCGNYDQMWCTTSLRGLIGGRLGVELIAEGVHSGDASGIVPSSFRVLRGLLDRLEDVTSGQIISAFAVDIPEGRRRQADQAAQVLGDTVYAKFPFHEGVSAVSSDLSELVLNRTWRAALSVTGGAGLPALRDAGNVLRPGTAVKLSLRIPPTLDAEAASTRLKELLEAEPPYQAKVEFHPDSAATGWNAPALAPWLEAAAEGASQMFFGRSAVYMGEGGAIPFMGMLGEKFPTAQFLVTGVLGPQSNAHGPNEFLHIPTGKKLTCCVAQVLADHGTRLS